ncbi:MAG: hypothetical protein JJ992_01450 [Planctomycetes bacterium]|nr:hypothetical protein [Planctomycetota bacterium]
MLNHLACGIVRATNVSSAYHRSPYLVSPDGEFANGLLVVRFQQVESRAYIVENDLEDNVHEEH